MTTKKYRVHDWVKFQYSEIGEYVDENHTDKPLRNDEVVDLLNELNEDKNDLITALQLSIDKNEQLKQTIQEVAELLSEEVDLFSDKATEHDIIAYTELHKLDNKDAYYMATATKKAIKMLKELQE